MKRCRKVSRIDFQIGVRSRKTIVCRVPCALAAESIVGDRSHDDGNEWKATERQIVENK